MAHPVSIWLRCATLWAVIAISYVASAGDSPSSSTTDAAARSKEIEGTVLRAREARSAGRFADAQTVLDAALSSEDAGGLTAAERAELVGELGLTELAQRKYRDAAEHIHQSFARWADLSLSFRLELQDGFRQALEPIGRIYLSLSPPDAAVLFDGRPIGRVASTYVLFAEPGRHTIRARLNGHKDDTQTFDIAKGQSTQITMALPASPAPAASLLKATPAPVSTAPPQPESVTTASKLRVAGAILAGATAAAGGTFFVWSAVTDRDFDHSVDAIRGESSESNACLPPNAAVGCSALRDLRARRDVLYDAGWVSVVASGAIGAVTITSLLISRATPKKTGAHLVPMATGQQAGLMIYGVW